jgi:diguanylate cyclase (GGDEF)-like protein
MGDTFSLAPADLRDPFRAVADHAPYPIARYDREAHAVYRNPAAERLLDAAAGAPLDGPVREAMARGAEMAVEATVGRPEGTVHIRTRIVPERDADGSVVGAIVYGEPAADHAAPAPRPRAAGTLDPLCGVLTREAFLHALDEAWAERGAEGAEGFTVLFVDLDRFKQVNDRLGHPAGDTVLRTVGERLLSCVRPTDAVGRLGGDEFGVLLRGAAREAHAVGAVQRIQRELERPIRAGGVELRVTASVGVALDAAFKGPHGLLASADRAMYQAKAFGPGQFELLDREALAREAAVRAVEEDLARALERGELRVHYQPIVRLADGAPVAHEALVRWEHPERGLLGPQAFLPVAERSRMIVDVDRWVLRQAARRAAEGGGPPVSVNFSGAHVVWPDCAGYLMGVVEELGLDPRRLLVEVTETALMDASEAAALSLARAREAGIRVCLDDFGSGYSSLPYLRRFTFDLLKIDRSFVHRVVRDARDRAIVRATATLARELDLGVVAEGIETAEQREILLELGCEWGQGFLFGRPAP